MGAVAVAVGNAAQIVTCADRSGDECWTIHTRVRVADVVYLAGRRAEAETRCREAEQMQTDLQPDEPLRHSLRGFKYCDLLLAAPERAAWQTILRGAAVSERPASAAPSTTSRWAAPRFTRRSSKHLGGASYTSPQLHPRSQGLV